MIFNSGVYDVISEDYTYAISAGKVDGLLPWSKAGYTPASTTGETVIWSAGTDYIFPSAAMGMEVISTDNTNDKAGGTGALTVKICYLTNTFDQKSEIVTLNGTTAVPTVATDIYRINAFCVYSWGSAGKNAGIITIRHLDDTPIYEHIAVGKNTSRSFFYTVPNGYMLSISNIYFSASANAAGKRVLVTTMGTYDSANKRLTSGSFFPYTEHSLVDTAMSIDLQMPTMFPAGTDLKIIVIGEAGAVCTCGARGWLKPV